jgi:hypothetical protein
MHVVIQDRIDSCPYAYYFDRVTWNYDCGTLTLQGRVGTFHLKQILQSMLTGLELVQRIDNQVAVVSSTGLSSEPEGELRPEDA